MESTIHLGCSHLVEFFGLASVARHLTLEVAAKVPAGRPAASGLAVVQWCSVCEPPLPEVDTGHTAGCSVSESSAAVCGAEAGRALGILKGERC